VPTNLAIVPPEHRGGLFVAKLRRCVRGASGEIRGEFRFCDFLPAMAADAVRPYHAELRA